MIHIGAYFVIPVQYEYYETDVRTCGEHIIYDHKAKFCSSCGKEIKTQKIEKKRLLSISDIVGNENLHSYFIKENMYVFSNIKLLKEINLEEDIMSDITCDIINQNIETFKNTHKANIDILENKLNLKVDIKFGVMEYYY